MKLQHEFSMARQLICDLPPLPTKRRYRAYLEMLEKAIEKERKEDAE